MKVQQVIPLEGHSMDEVNKIMNSFVKGSLDHNATAQTLEEHFRGEAPYGALRRVSFSSARKWSALELDGAGTLIVGAPEFILPEYAFDETVENARSGGSRVLLAALHPDFASFQENLSAALPLQPLSSVIRCARMRKKPFGFFREMK